MFDGVSLIIYNNANIPNWILFIINIIGFLIALKIVYFVLKVVLKLITKKTKNNFDDELLRIIEYPLIIIISLFFSKISLSILGLSDSVLNIINIIINILLLGVITWFLYSLINVVYQNILVPISKRSKSNLDDRLYPLLRKVLKVILICFSVLYFFDLVGINITPLLAGAGIGGVAIAFAAQKSISDLFGGVSILADKAYFVGDRIKVNDVIGTVVDLGLRSTKLKTFDETVITIPNSVMAESNIENFNKNNKAITVRNTIGLTYNTSNEKLNKAKKIIIDILSKNEHVIDTPVINFTNFNAFSLDLSLSFKIDNFENKSIVLDNINMKIKEKFEKEKIEFAYPSQTIYLKK